MFQCTAPFEWHYLISHRFGNRAPNPTRTVRSYPRSLYDHNGGNSFDVFSYKGMLKALSDAALHLLWLVWLGYNVFVRQFFCFAFPTCSMCQLEVCDHSVRKKESINIPRCFLKYWLSVSKWHQLEQMTYCFQWCNPESLNCFQCFQHE